jgi:hypothetical protein
MTMPPPGQPVMNKMPRCYKHSDRETLVSCGHCGRALCPDCMHHGPVGVRCWECLHPLNHGPQLIDVNVGAAMAAAVGLAIVWLAAMVGASLWQAQWQIGMIGTLFDPNTLAPNLLLATLGGGTVGALQWKMCGGAWDKRMRTFAAIVGVLMPLLAAAGVGVMAVLQQLPQPAVQYTFLIRTAVAMLLSGLAALVMATQTRR